MDEEIHTAQLSFSDDVFNPALNLLTTKWRSELFLANFCHYINQQ